MCFTAAAPGLNICRRQSGTACIERVFSQHSELCSVPIWAERLTQAAVPRSAPLAVARGRGPAEAEPPVLPLPRAALALCRDGGRVLEVKVTVQNILIAEFQYVSLYYFFLVYSCGPGYLTVDCSKKAIFYYFKFVACLLFWFQHMYMLKCYLPVKRRWLFQTKCIPEETHRIKCVQADLISALVFHIFSMQSSCW